MAAQNTVLNSCSPDDEDTCMSCFMTTKYCCMRCNMVVCNKCSVFEDDDETLGWKVGKSVGYCEACSKSKEDTSWTTGTPKQPQERTPALQSATPKESVSHNVSEDEEDSEILPRKSKKQKVGRKSHWTTEQLDDLIDIVINNDNFKEKLIFHNTKFQRNSQMYEQILKKLEARCVERQEEFNFSVDQVRSKFKKCVSECKKLALTIKTATGVENFIKDKGYGATFNQLYALVKTRDACNPEKALEPSAASVCNTVPDEESTAFGNSEASGSGEKRKNKLFVPVRKKKGKHNDDSLTEAINLMKGVIENDHTQDMIKLMREDMEKSRQHELRLMEMLLGVGNQQPSVEQQGSQFIQHSGYIQSNASGGYCPPFSPTMSASHHSPSMPANHHGHFSHDFSMQQGYQFHPVSLSTLSRPPSVASSYSGRSSPSAESIINESPDYHSM